MEINQLSGKHIGSSSSTSVIESGDRAVPNISDNYLLVTFVAVKSDSSGDGSTYMFSIGEVLDSYRGKMKKVTSLRIQWYSLSNYKFI